jgi:predicted nucleotidyltransferase
MTALFCVFGFRNKVVLLQARTQVMISELQKDIIINTIMPFHPVRIGIFGSVARNEHTDDSDIDILYSLKDAIGLFELIRIKDSLEEQLHTKVDMVSEKYVHPKLKPCIMSDLKIIYSNGE